MWKCLSGHFLFDMCQKIMLVNDFIRCDGNEDLSFCDSCLGMNIRMNRPTFRISVTDNIQLVLIEARLAK